MNTTAIRALIRNDIRLYFSDRRSVIVGVLVPILIAAFFGYLPAAASQRPGPRRRARASEERQAKCSGRIPTRVWLALSLGGIARAAPQAFAI
jgi:hypothetical protein